MPVTYTDRQKATAVNRVKNLEWTYQATAEKAGCTIETVCYWVARSEGFKTTGDWRKSHGKTRPGKRRNGKTTKAPTNGSLPTTAAVSVKRAPKAKALVAIAYQCPHCGGPVEVAH